MLFYIVLKQILMRFTHHSVINPNSKYKYYNTNEINYVVVYDNIKQLNFYQKIKQMS